MQDPFIFLSPKLQKQNPKICSFLAINRAQKQFGLFELILDYIIMDCFSLFTSHLNKLHGIKDFLKPSIWNLYIYILDSFLLNKAY